MDQLKQKSNKIYDRHKQTWTQHNLLMFLLSLLLDDVMESAIDGGIDSGLIW